MQLLVENHGLSIKLLTEDTLYIKLALRPPGIEPAECVQNAVSIETKVTLPPGTIDAWLAEHQGKCVCEICGETIPILRRHYWRGLPRFHHECWASQVTRRRANPDSDNPGFFKVFGNVVCHCSTQAIGFEGLVYANGGLGGVARVQCGLCRSRFHISFAAEDEGLVFIYSSSESVNVPLGAKRRPPLVEVDHVERSQN